MLKAKEWELVPQAIDRAEELGHKMTLTYRENDLNKWIQTSKWECENCLMKLEVITNPAQITGEAIFNKCKGCAE